MTDTSMNYIITSHSIDGTFESCPRRFEFRHVYMQLPTQEPRGLAADVGTALHEAVQEWTRTYSDQASDLMLLRHWPWDLEEKRRQAGFPRDLRRTIGNALLLLQEIRQHKFWQEWEVAKLPDGSFAIELPWRINHVSLGLVKHPATGKPYQLATQGKIDWILQHKQDRKRFMVCDLKTTILDEQAQDASFRFSGQAGQYGLVLAQAMGWDWAKEGLEVTYFIGEFGTHGEPSAEPMTHKLSPDEVYDSIAAKNERLDRMVQMGKEGFWPRRSHGCSFYGTPCGFLNICSRREPEYLQKWFSFEDDFKTESRIYEPVWTIEA